MSAAIWSRVEAPLGAGMRATCINHVSVSARDLAESVVFSTDVLGWSRRQSDVGSPVQGVQLGQVQRRRERDSEPSSPYG